MALGTPVVGAAAYSASGGTTVTPAYPAGILATDAVLLFVGQKPSTANGGTVTTPAGWTLREELTGAGGYGATLGADTGNTNLRVYSWDTPVAGQTGTQSVTLGVNNISWAFIVRVPTEGGTLSYGSADGQRTTTPTSPMSIALTNGASPTAFQAGDLALWAMCIPTDVQTPTQFSNQVITATGATFATAVELNEPDSTTGNDIGGYSARALVTAGTSSTAPTVVVNLAGTLTNVRGPVCLVRIRETPLPPQPILYWVGGTGAWSISDTSKWSLTPGGAGGAGIPSSITDVFINNTSDVGAPFTITMTGVLSCKSLTVSGLDQPLTLTGTGSLSIENLIFPVSNFTSTYTGNISYIGTLNQTVNTNGHTFGSNVAFGAGTNALTNLGSTGTLGMEGVAINPSGLIVAVGNGGNIYTSTDAITWTPRTSGTTSTVRDVTWGNGEFIAVGNSGVMIASTDGTTWTARTSGTGNVLYFVTYYNSLYVAGGFFSIRTSTDGVTWTSRFQKSNGFDFNSVAYGNGKYVAVGSNGDANVAPVIATSADGITWTEQTVGPTIVADLNQVAFGNGVFVAGGASGLVVTSADGITWTKRESRSSRNVGTLIFSNNFFYLTVSFGLAACSYDGVYWTYIRSPSTETIDGLAGQDDFLVAVGGSTSFVFSSVVNTLSSYTLPSGYNATGTITLSKGNLFVSSNVNAPNITIASDTVDSTSLYMGSGNWNLSGTGAVWQDLGSQYSWTDPGTSTINLTNTTTTARTFSGNSKHYHNLNIGGTTGSSTTAITGDNTFNQVSSSKTVAHTMQFAQSSATSVTDFTVSGSPGNLVTVQKQPASIPWSRSKNITNANINVAWVRDVWIAVGVSSTVLRSVDGISWSDEEIETGAFFEAISSINTTLYLVAGSSGSIYTSPNGINWTSRTSGTTSNLQSADTDGTTTVIVGDGGVILTSTDGTTWAPRTSGTTVLLEGVIWGGSLFVAVGNTGTVLTSPNGINWTPQTSGTTNNIVSIAWANNLFVFVGTSGLIRTSPDGITWTTRTSGTGNTLFDIVWATNKFVAVGNSGVIVSSPTGETWTAETSGVTITLFGVGANSSQIIAIGEVYLGFLRSSVNSRYFLSQSL